MSNSDDSMLKDLVKLIPGYGAYVEQESRRNDDRLTREFLGQRLDDCKVKLTKIGKQAVSSGDLETPAKLESFIDGVDRAQRRLAAAVEGYASWFGHRQVDAALLKEISELDTNMVSLVDQMDAIAAAAAQASELNWNDLGEAIDRLHARIDRRSEMLKSGS